MEYEDRELIVYEIVSGKTYATFRGQEYHTVINTVDDKHRASIFYKQLLDDLKYESIMSWEEAQRVSARLGLWTSENEAGLESLNNMLEDLKLQLYLSHYLADRVESFKKQIEKVKHGIDKSTNNKYSLYHATKEYYASTMKKQYLIALSIRDEDDQPIYTHKNFWVSDPTILNIFFNKSMASYSAEQFREVARTDPWRSMWSGSKGHVYGTPSSQWTEEQRILVAYSKMYDSVHESMDSPPDEVIEDDDMLDGWFIKQRKDREKSKREKQTADMFKGNKKGGNQELFLMAGNKDQAKNIYNMNDEQGKNTIKNREREIKSKGSVQHQDLKDVQMDMRMQATRETMEHMRKR